MARKHRHLVLQLFPQPAQPHAQQHSGATPAQALGMPPGNWAFGSTSNVVPPPQPPPLPVPPVPTFLPGAWQHMQPPPDLHGFSRTVPAQLFWVHVGACRSVACALRLARVREP